MCDHYTTFTKFHKTRQDLFNGFRPHDHIVTDSGQFLDLKRNWYLWIDKFRKTLRDRSIFHLHGSNLDDLVFHRTETRRLQVKDHIGAVQDLEAFVGGDKVLGGLGVDDDAVDLAGGQRQHGVGAGLEALDGAEAESLYFGGLATKRQRAVGPVAFYSCSGTAFDGIEASGTDVVEERAFVAPQKPLKLRGTHEVSHAGTDLSRASVIVGAGRGFAHEEDLELARSLASAVHGELACSRPLAESEKWLPKNTYLGVSGRMVSPKVYFAVGISGQMQHMIGVHNADVVVAVNKDQNAPVFAQADYGLVADLHEALPALVEKLS